MKTAIIVQARMTSTRLPGKVLLPLAGEPMLARLIERLRRVQLADVVAIATTQNAADDPIVALCDQLGVPSYRGSELDVLSRYCECAEQLSAEVVVRVTSDCPLLDPALIDRIISSYQKSDADYASNTLEPSWPYGMAVEVFSARALSEAHREARQAAEREHVTPYIYWNPQRFRLLNVRNEENLSHLRLTVDTPEDYELVHRVFAAAYSQRHDFGLIDVLQILQANPQWLNLNQHIEQRQAVPDDPHLQESKQ
jgi:spore coat polysaccharide biosynthesis protein SpsF